MKIAFWHYYTFRLSRGIETLTISLANALARKKNEVAIIAATPVIPPLIKPDPAVKLHIFPTTKYFEHITMVPFYYYHFLTHTYDHVITFFSDFGEGATCRLLSPIKNIPMSLYLCYPQSVADHRYKSFMKYGWDKSAKNIWADARWIADEAKRLMHREVSVLPVGTDTNRFKPDGLMKSRMREKYGFKEDDVVLLNVAALEKRKGIGRVLEALSRLKRQFSNLRYFILGKGDDETKLRGLVRELGLEKEVIFAGEVQNLEIYYQMSDIFVMLSDGEANALASYEAMSSGLPLIVSRAGGFEEGVSDTAGFLVALHSATEIDAAFIKLIENTKMRQEMGRAARQHILENYDWDIIADKAIALLEKK